MSAPARQEAAAQQEPFWRRKRLAEMSRAEWEALCDGCGKCCLHKLEDADSGEVHPTNLACRLLDLGSCRCIRYEKRKRLVPDCIVLSPRNVTRLSWMPSTCAYRLVAEGRELPWWHHLVCGDPEEVHRVGASVRGRAVSERHARAPLEDFVLEQEL